MTRNKYKDAEELLESIAQFDIRINTMAKEILYWHNQEDVDSWSHIQNLQHDIRQLRETKLRVSRLISKLPDNIGRVIFTQRYIFNEKWKSIATSIGNMSVRNIHYIHEKSMKEFVKLLQEENKNDKN